LHRGAAGRDRPPRLEGLLPTQVGEPFGRLLVHAPLKWLRAERRIVDCLDAVAVRYSAETGMVVGLPHGLRRPPIPCATSGNSLVDRLDFPYT
jgi:hypothetical protein